MKDSIVYDRVFFFNIGMYRHYYLYMKTLYESILDSDIMDKADKAVELVGQFRDMLNKGMSREYSAAEVKRHANEFVKKT